jgi:hypothetical protein
MGAAAEHLLNARPAMLREDDGVHRDMEGSMKFQPDSVEEYRAHVYQDGWHRGFAAGFACAAVVALGVVFCLLAYGTFDKPVQTTVKSDAPKRQTGKP